MRLWRVTLWAVAGIPLLFLLLFFVWPLASLIITGSGWDSGSTNTEGVTTFLREERTLKALTQTILQALAGTATSLVLGIPAAFVLYRTTFPGQTILRGLLTVPFVLPTVVVAVAFQALFGPGGPLEVLRLDRSFTVIVLALAFFNMTVVIRVVGGFWHTLDPRQEQAARVLGASPWRTFTTVTLPRLLPAIGSAAALVFLFCSTAFGVVLILGGKTFSNLETEMYRLTMQFLDLRGASILAMVQVAIVAGALWVSSRLRQPQHDSTSRTPPTHPRLGKQHTPVILLIAITIVCLHVLPMVALLTRSLRNSRGEWTLDHYRFLFFPPKESPLSESVLHALGHSLVFAIIATAITMALGIMIALVLSRRTRSAHLRRASQLGETVLMLPLGVSAVTLGLGLLLTMHHPLGIGIDLRSSSVLIPVAQTLIALPIVVRTIIPVLKSLDPRTLDAARLLGASPGAVFRTVELPLLGNTLGLAAGFAFATALGEFGATSFLARSGAETLPVVIATLSNHQAPSSYGTSLAAAMLLGLITTGVMLSAERATGTQQTGIAL